MAKAKPSDDKKPARKRRPALTPEARENQLIALAVDLVERRLIEGTASSQETTHFLKLGSSRERLEREILQRQKELTEAKTENMRSPAHNDELFTRAIEAMSRYRGNQDDEDAYETFV